MAELLSFAPLSVVLGLLLVCLALVATPLLLSSRQPASPVVGTRSFRTSYLVVLGCGLLLMLSACGTAPSQAPWCPQVPAELLVEPMEPVLMRPTSASKRLGPTTLKMPSAAASTARTTGN